MLDKDHVLVSEAIYLGATPLIFTTNRSLLVAGALGVFIGCQVPDMDTTSSKIGQMTRPISTLIAHFGHRGITHSLFGLLFFIIFVDYFLRGRWMSFMWYWLYGEWPMFLNGMIIGYALHLIEDWFSRSGVIWLFPSHIESYRKWYPPKLKSNGYQYYSPRYLKRIEPPIYIRTGITKWFRYHSTDRGIKGRYERNIRKVAVIVIVLDIIPLV